MKTDTIAKIYIDGSARLCVSPSTEKFTMIYRAAIEVHWDEAMQCLYSPKPREWGYLQWFQQIVTGVESEYGYHLQLKPETEWTNIPSDLRLDIENWMKQKAEQSVPGYPPQGVGSPEP